MHKRSAMHRPGRCGRAKAVSGVPAGTVDCGLRPYPPYARWFIRTGIAALRVAVVRVPPDEGAGRVGCAVGRSCPVLRLVLRVSHAPRERPFFPARVHWSCCDSPGTEPRGLSSKPCAGAAVQGFVTEPPWTLRLRPGGNAVRVRFALQPMTGLQLLHCRATPQSQLASSPGSPDLAGHGS